MNLPTELADYGVVGICIALIILIAFIIKNVATIFKNHIQHNTESQIELTKVIAELKEFLMRKNGK